MVPALYELDSESFVSTDYTRGPWRHDAQHGGPPAGLLGRAVEQALPAEFAVGRITVNLVKPVPLSTLVTSAEVIKLSRRITRIEAELRSGSDLVGSATALALRTERGLEPEWLPTESSVLAAEGGTVDAPDWQSDPNHIAYHRDSLELRVIDGVFGEAGPATAWARMKFPLVRGEVTSPLCRVLCVADLGSGISSAYSTTASMGMINADLSLAVTRPLMGEWVRMQSKTRVATHGIGLCVSQMADEFGHVGEATQSLLAIGTNL
jgi:hypothetical protein